MKATEANLLQFLNGNIKQFVIPIYQRTYSWNIEQCKQLWEDILRVAKRPEIPSHFIGSIVYISKGIIMASAIQEGLVIDGQQRLTTLTLLLVALGNAIENGKQEIDLTQRKISSYYLVNFEEDGDFRYRLLLTQTDRETLMKLVDGNELPKNASTRIVENYQFFVKMIAECKLPLYDILTGIRKLVIVDVSLDRSQDNPQLIFESLNSTGLELSQADLIRNYILMGLENKHQIDLYNNYWFPMEQSFGHTESTNYFDRFMRDYLTIKNEGRIPNIDKVYIEFKDYVRRNPSFTMDQIVQDIYRYSKHFVRLAFEKEQDKEIKAALKDINTLKVDVAYPFLLEVLDDYEQGKIQRQELISILRMVESYIFRRVICGIPTNSLNKTFASLYREIKKPAYLESLQAALLIKDSYRRFPQDEEFRQQFILKDVYNFRTRNYLLRKLENAHREKEIVNIEEYTIEHVMPQNEILSDAWKKELGANWQQIQLRYLHTIGNLTLTGYNSEYSDRPFLEKRDYPDRKGFYNSPLYLNEYLATLKHWNEKTILARAEILAEDAIKVWAIPVLQSNVLSKYQPKSTGSNEIEEYTLEHYEYLQGKMLELFQSLRRRVLNIDSAVHEEHKKLYIAFKSTTNFVDVVPQKSKLRLSINIPFSEIIDPKGLCRDITGLGRWGNGDVEVSLSSEDQLDDIMEIIEQGFVYQI